MHFHFFSHLLNHQNTAGDTCLIIAVKNSKVEIVKSLCHFSKSSHASLLNINSSNNIKNTACHVAAINNSVTVMRVLVESGCDLLRMNGCGYNCHELAENFGHQELCEYLEPIIEEAVAWSHKNCLAKLFLNRDKIKERIPN